MKKLPVLLALSVISAALLAGCGGSGKTDSTELRYASMKDIRNINPHLYLGEMAAQAMVFEPLVVSTKDGIKPWLAESWTISPDGHTFIPSGFVRASNIQTGLRLMPNPSN